MAGFLKKATTYDRSDLSFHIFKKRIDKGTVCTSYGPHIIPPIGNSILHQFIEAQIRHSTCKAEQIVFVHE